MKTAVSIPDDVFEGAERLARKTKKSRSQLVSDALREYVARHAVDEVTEALDKLCSELGASDTGNERDFAREAARRILKRTER
jgi:predicted transcriptional regulator